MHFVRAANGFGRGLRETEIANFSLAYQIGHGPDRLFDRYSFIDAVLVVEINHLDAQPLQAAVACLLYVFWTAIHALVAPAFERSADQFFIFAGTVHIGCVQKRTAEFNGAMNGGNGLIVVASAVEL